VYPYYRVYATGDGYLCIATLSRGLREKLCEALEISDPDVAVDLGNISDATYYAQKPLMRAIEARLLERPNAYWIERLEAAGVPCGSVNYRAHLYNDPQVHALDMMWHLDNAELGQYKTVGHPIRFSKTPVRAGRGAPTLGQDSESVLLDFGWSAEAIHRLKQEGIVK